MATNLSSKAIDRLCGIVFLGIDDDTLGNWEGDWDDWDPDGDVDETGTEAHATDGSGLGMERSRNIERAMDSGSTDWCLRHISDGRDQM